MRHFYLPGWGWFIALAAIYLFYATNRSNRIRKERRQERISDRHDELLEMLRKKKEADPDKKDEPKTE
jgi:hypothetical protein